MCGLFAGCFNWPSLVAARLMMGVTQAGIFPATTMAVSQWFPPTQRAMPNGAITGFMQVGGVVGAMLTGWLVVSVGWRWMFAAYALPGFLWTLWFYGWYRNSPEEHPSHERRNGDEPAAAAVVPSEPTPWRVLLTNRAMAAVCGQQFCRAAASTFFASWFATYLQETRGVSLPAAGMLTGLPTLGMMLGSFAGGYASDYVFQRTGSLNAARRGISIWCMIICAGLASLAYFVADPVLATLLISAGSFWASVAGTCAYTFTIDVGGRHVPAVFSTMNMCGNIGSAVFPMLVPFFLRQTDDNWDLVLFLFVGLYIIAAGFWLLADAAKPIFAETRSESDNT
jgi:ACS family glucarate transporter-like MFS transporter/ACS family D-galactonate transporter-like MFS transporter